QGSTGLKNRQCADRPAPCQVTRKSTLEPAMSPSKRQFVDRAECETVLDIVLRGAIVRPPIIVVRVRSVLGPERSCPRVCAVTGIGEELRPRVSAYHGQTMSQPPFELEQSSVVVRDP